MPLTGLQLFRLLIMELTSKHPLQLNHQKNEILKVSLFLWPKRLSARTPITFSQLIYEYRHIT